MKTVFILGGGVMQLPAVRAARAKGWRIVVAAREVIPEVAEIADAVEGADLADKQAVTAAALACRDRWGLDGVFTAGTDFSTTASWVAEKLGIPGAPYAAALAATDKALMRETLSRQGVPCPRFVTVETGAKMDPHVLAGFPLVVKPVDNMGARGVRRVESREELEQALVEAWQVSRSGRAIVEEYLEGPELSLDALVYGGCITVCGIADRHICFPPYFVEMGHTMPSGLEEGTLAQAAEIFARGIRALGISEGAAKGDVKVTRQGPFIGEIAARLSGGYMSGWTYPLASGVEVTAAALNIAVGLPPGDLRPRHERCSAERAFISIPGVVAEMTGPSEVRRTAGVEELFLRAAVGQRVAFPINNLGKCGNVITCRADREQAIAAAEQAVRRIFIRLEPDREETDRFLFSQSPSPPTPPAFSPHGPGDAEGWRKLPLSSGKASALARGAEGMRILTAPLSGYEGARDWHGFGLREALDQVLERTGVGLEARPQARHLNLGSLFWRAFLRGSIQGGVYLIDTLFALRDDPRRLEAFLAGRA